MTRLRIGRSRVPAPAVVPGIAIRSVSVRVAVAVAIAKSGRRTRRRIERPASSIVESLTPAVVPGIAIRPVSVRVAVAIAKSRRRTRRRVERPATSIVESLATAAPVVVPTTAVSISPAIVVVITPASAALPLPRIVHVTRGATRALARRNTTVTWRNATVTWRWHLPGSWKRLGRRGWIPTIWKRGRRLNHHGLRLNRPRVLVDVDAAGIVPGVAGRMRRVVVGMPSRQITRRTVVSWMGVEIPNHPRSPVGVVGAGVRIEAVIRRVVVGVRSGKAAPVSARIGMVVVVGVNDAVLNVAVPARADDASTKQHHQGDGENQAFEHGFIPSFGCTVFERQLASRRAYEIKILVEAVIGGSDVGKGVLLQAVDDVLTVL
jgi:hypothetical protein